MLTFDKFIGINNVQPSHRLKPNELTVASDVNIGLDSEIRRRQGFSEVSSVCHKNVWQADSFMLATCNGDLVRTDGATQTVLLESLGTDRVWYCNLPDGRTTFSNGLISGLTDGTGVTTWGVPLPPSVGAATAVSGDLAPGEYRWAITYVRMADGLEGGASYAEPVELAAGGLLLTGLPQDPDYAIRVYLSNGAGFYYAGVASGPNFSFLGKNDALVLPLRTDQLYPMPVGTLTAFWRGRVLVAKGPVLYASKPHQWEHCDMRRDFKQFSSPITLVQPLDGGLYVGTETELAYLDGAEWDKLSYVQASADGTVLGSGVTVHADMLRTREGGNFRGMAMVCINGGRITYGYNGGSIWRVTEGVYHTSVSEVAATFRRIDGIPQYVAVPQ
jgi:hypothetical protein